MSATIHSNKRFFKILKIANITGVIANLYIFAVIFATGERVGLLSPGLGALIYFVNHLFLKDNKRSINTAFIVASITLIIEVFYHTYLLGWNSGFYFFYLLLPTVFLLNFRWSRLWGVIYNSALIAALIVTGLIFFDATPDVIISDKYQQFIGYANVMVVLLIIFVVLIFFQKVIKEKEFEIQQTNELLKQNNQEITEQRDQLEMLLKEVHHRVKNNLQVISSLVSLQLGDIKSEKAKYALKETQRRITSIALIHQKLYQGRDINRVRFHSYVQEILDFHFSMNPSVKSEIECDNELEFNLDLAMPLGLIISELISNCYKHAYEGIADPRLKISLQSKDGDYKISVCDNGVGISNDFSLEDPSSLGFEIVTTLVEQVGAEISFKNNDGACFYITFNIKKCDSE